MISSSFLNSQFASQKWCTPIFLPFTPRRTHCPGFKLDSPWFTPRSVLTKSHPSYGVSSLISSSKPHLPINIFSTFLGSKEHIVHPFFSVSALLMSKTVHLPTELKTYLMLFLVPLATVDDIPISFPFCPTCTTMFCYIQHKRFVINHTNKKDKHNIEGQYEKRRRHERARKRSNEKWWS